MTGWSFYVGVKLWPPSLVVEFAPAETEEAARSGGHVSDEVYDVDDADGLYANRCPMGFAGRRGHE